MTFSKAGKGNPHYLSVVSKKQNKTTTKNLMIFLSQDYKYNSDKKIIVKNEDESDLMLNVFTIWCTWISKPVVYFL